ncbi:MAG: dTDP-4-dehydrorhamnose 3,5-epimerase [Bacteroides sp.]
MKQIPTSLEGVVLLEPRVYGDSRGYFFELYNQATFHALGLDYTWVQDNESRSSYGVIRGLHYQQAPYAQAKLVRAVVGRIFDVAVDIRPESTTFGRWVGYELNDSNHRMLLIPRGFAHGFSVLSPVAVVHYKCDALYTPASEGGVMYDDPQLAIDWQIPNGEQIVSKRDCGHQRLADLR